jgi:hypothetical protein
LEKINTIEDFIKETLELINNGKIVTLGLDVDAQIDWYGNNIITSLKLINEEYKKDNSKKLFEEIKNDLQESINELTAKSNILYNLYSKIDILPEKEVNELKKSSERDENNSIKTYIENEEKKIFSCYTLNQKILDYVKENKSVDECILILKGINPEEKKYEKDEKKKEEKKKESKKK